MAAPSKVLVENGAAMETARLGRLLEAIKGCCGLLGAGNLLFNYSWEDSMSIFTVPFLP